MMNLDVEFQRLFKLSSITNVHKVVEFLNPLKSLKVHNYRALSILIIADFKYKMKKTTQLPTITKEKPSKFKISIFHVLLEIQSRSIKNLNDDAGPYNIHYL